MNRHRYTLSETYRRCLSPVLPSQLHTTLPLLAEGSLLRRLIITCPTFGLFLWIPVKARSARWIFPGKNWVKLTLVAVNTTTSFPGFFSYCAGSSRKEPWERVCEHQAISSAFALFLENMKMRESFIEKSCCLCMINVPSTWYQLRVLWASANVICLVWYGYSADLIFFFWRLRFDVFLCSIQFHLQLVKWFLQFAVTIKVFTYHVKVNSTPRRETNVLVPVVRALDGANNI